MRLNSIFSFLLISIILLCSQLLQAGDWPMWRYDVNRSAATQNALPEQLDLLWTRALPPVQPAWPASQTKLNFDRQYEPIVLGTRMFVGSSYDDSLTAYNTETGEVLWKFFAGGPIRFAPVAENDRLYVVSDDGFLYCINAKTGKEVWRVNGGPTVRPIIGNDRLVSTWPARGGPVLADNVVYFAASIWPSMGTFIHAVDAKSGKLLWTNSETGAQFMTHPHSADSFGSIAPQGYLLISGDNLIVPGGRSTPAVFDRKTGKLRYFRFDKRSGGSAVYAAGIFYCVDGERYAVSDGNNLDDGDGEVFSGNEEYFIDSRQTYLHCNVTTSNITSKKGVDRKGRKIVISTLEQHTKWKLKLPDSKLSHTFAKAGSALYLGGKSKVAAFNINGLKGTVTDAKPVWSADVDGNVASIIAADDKLFVVTDKSKIYCFGKKPAQALAVTHHSWKPNPLKNLAEKWNGTLSNMLRDTQDKSGYAVVLGVGSKGLIHALLKQTHYHVIVIDDDSQKVFQLQSELAASGLYGERISALVGDLDTLNLPPYMASAIFSESPPAAQSRWIKNVFQTLRPYGGRAAFVTNDEQHTRLQSTVANTPLKNAKLTRGQGVSFLTRVGRLPGSADWNAQHADAANSVVSKDKLVKAPLGILWFGGPPNDKILPRHGHGPSPQVAGGRVVIEGPDILRAVDVYTGRLLWEANLPGVGEYYNVTKHFAGAGEVGSNYVTLKDFVYVIYNKQIIELDAATGKQIRTFNRTKNKAKQGWGFLTVWNNLLVATARPVKIDDSKKSSSSGSLFKEAKHSSASQELVIFDRKSGKELWSRTANYGFRHNCIAVGAGMVYCIDGMSSDKLKTLERRGVKFSGKPHLLALNANTGKEIWTTNENVFGTFLNYSTAHDVLLQAGSNYRDRAKDESKKGMVTYNGKTGKVIWKDLEIAYGGPCLLWRDKIITNGASGFQLNLFDGKKTDFTFRRMYGCNTIVGSENLLTFRSGAAGFCDLAGNSGTGNLSGFKSSCTANLIVADGVLNAPDYTRTCSCSYQNQSSLAFIHMPEAEEWTFSHMPLKTDYLRSIGINFGAPGDRRDASGVLWLDYPIVGGPTPQFKIEVKGNKPKWFRRHSSLMQGTGPRWVGASGGLGIDSVTLQIAADKSKERLYTVELFFAEPETITTRNMTIALQGKQVLSNFNPHQEAGGKFRTISRKFTGIKIKDKLKIDLKSDDAATLICGMKIQIEEPKRTAKK